MEKLLKRAKIDYSSEIIAVATDMKSKSMKQFINIIFRMGCLGFGIVFFYLILMIVSALFAEPFDIIVSSGIIILLLLSVIFCLGSFWIAIFLISTKSMWFLVLYKECLLYKYNVNRGMKRAEYRQIELPIKQCERCFILCEYKKGFENQARGYFMSVHFQYIEDNHEKYLSIFGFEGYEDMDHILQYLAKEKKIPMLYATANTGYDGELHEIESLSGAEQIQFTGNLRDYNKGSFLQ